MKYLDVIKNGAMQETDDILPFSKENCEFNQFIAS